MPPRTRQTAESPKSDEGPKVDQHVQAAIEEEQRLLDEATTRAQLQHLLRRSIDLNAAARRAAEPKS